MALRNFWYDIKIDGRRTTLSGGPVARDGGGETTLKQLVNGSIVKIAEIGHFSRVHANGTTTVLETRITLPDLTDPTFHRAVIHEDDGSMTINIISHRERTREAQ